MEGGYQGWSREKMWEYMQPLVEYLIFYKFRILLLVLDLDEID